MPWRRTKSGLLTWVAGGLLLPALGDPTLLGGSIRIFPNGNWWIESDNPIEDCCCPTRECGTLCATGFPTQIKVSISGQIASNDSLTGLDECDDPAGCDDRDVFLPWFDTGSGNECYYIFCEDDPCNAGSKIVYSFFFTPGVLSTGLAWAFGIGQGCPDCTGVGCDAKSTYDVDQDFGDFTWLDPGVTFDCLGLVDGTGGADRWFETPESAFPGTTPVPWCRGGSILVTAIA